MTSAPTLVPSTLNCTPATATLSVALADTVIEPETVAPPEGAEIDTVGGVLSPAGAANVTRRNGRKLGSECSMLAKYLNRF